MPKHVKDLDITFDAQAFAWNTGKTLRGVTFNRKEGEWMVVVRATTRKGKPVVSFVSGKDLRAVWAAWVSCASGRDAKDWWHTDKYA